MKISELIVVLAKALQEHGDIQVVKVVGSKEMPITGATVEKSPYRPIQL